jgi:hypothetical protein
MGSVDLDKCPIFHRTIHLLEMIHSHCHIFFVLFFLINPFGNIFTYINWLVFIFLSSLLVWISPIEISKEYEVYFRPQPLYIVVSLQMTYVHRDNLIAFLLCMLILIIKGLLIYTHLETLRCKLARSMLKQLGLLHSVMSMWGRPLVYTWLWNWFQIINSIT